MGSCLLCFILRYKHHNQWLKKIKYGAETSQFGDCFGPSKRVSWENVFEWPQKIKSLNSESPIPHLGGWASRYCRGRNFRKHYFCTDCWVVHVTVGNKCSYYMAKPVLGKSLCSDWFFLGQDMQYGPFPIRVFLYWSKAGKFKICNQNSEKKSVNNVILHIETIRRK